MANVYPGGKTTISIGSVIANVVEITPPLTSRETIDTTNLDTTGVESHRKATLQTAGEGTVSLFFDPSTHSGLPDMVDDNTAEDIVITHLDADGTAVGTASFSASVISFQLNGLTRGSNVGAELGLKKTTVITYA